MKIKTTLAVLLLINTIVAAQTEYEVVPNTKENQVILNVVNESKTFNADKVTVTLTNKPKGIEVCTSIVDAGSLKIGEGKETMFSFDTKRIPGAKKDTLRFLITDNYGGSWKKEIALKYALPKEFKLEQNYPNPFNPTTTIEFAIPQKGRYTLSIYNILGQRVNILTDSEYEAGYYKVNFDASRYSSGIYIYRLTGDKVNISKKMLMVK
jgi:Secretion system C-terminal sorting domain